MNVRMLLSLLVVSFLCLVPSFLLTGCESDDSPNTSDLDGYFENHPFVSDPRNQSNPRVMDISPSSATVTFPGEKVSFKASGGDKPYQWDVADGSKGSIVGTGDNQQDGIYTANVVWPNDVIVYDSQGNAAVATINGPLASLVATANPSILTADFQWTTLAASGGVPPYAWSLGDVGLGHLSSSIGNSVVYQRLAGGDNSVTVADAAGATYSLVVKQP